MGEREREGERGGEREGGRYQIRMKTIVVHRLSEDTSVRQHHT